MLRDGIEPRIFGVEIGAVGQFSKGPVLVLYVPRSFNGPHMFKGSPRFYTRNSNGNQPLDVHETRQAFLSSTDASNEVRDWRAYRLASNQRGIGGPMILMVSLLGVRDHTMDQQPSDSNASRQVRRRPRPIDPSRIGPQWRGRCRQRLGSGSRRTLAVMRLRAGPPIGTFAHLGCCCMRWICSIPSQ